MLLYLSIGILWAMYYGYQLFGIMFCEDVDPNMKLSEQEGLRTATKALWDGPVTMSLSDRQIAVIVVVVYCMIWITSVLVWPYSMYRYILKCK